jgi:hypothetical protein
MSPQNPLVPLVESQMHVIDPANSGRALNDSVKHRLHICRRAADDAEYLGCCRLVLSGFLQVLGDCVLPPQRFGDLLVTILPIVKCRFLPL